MMCKIVGDVFLAVLQGTDKKEVEKKIIELVEGSDQQSSWSITLMT